MGGAFRASEGWEEPSRSTERIRRAAHRQGVLAAFIRPYEDDKLEIPVTGMVKLAGGKATPFLSVPDSLAKKGLAFDVKKLPFTASGHSLVLPVLGGKDTTLVNLRTRQTWTVKAPKGMTTTSAAASGGVSCGAAVSPSPRAMM